MTRRVAASGKARALDLMARTIYGEARGEALTGKVAVAWVIVNRAERGGWWGSAIAEVCTKPRQFSCWNEDDPNFPIVRGVALDDDVFQDCWFAALGVIRRHLPDPTDGSTHYHAKSLRRLPPWAIDRVPACTIGGHVFYREVL